MHARHIIAAAILMLLPGAPARADTVTAYVQVVCVPQLDMLEIRPVTVNGAAAAGAVKRWPDTLMRRHGLYALEPLMVVRDGRVEQIKARLIDCRLSRGRVRVTIRPLPGNWNLGGRCGGALSISVTIHERNRMLADDLPFEGHCSLPHRIDRMAYFPGEGYVQLAGKFPSPPHRASDEIPAGLFFFIDQPDFATLRRETVGF